MGCCSPTTYGEGCTSITGTTGCCQPTTYDEGLFLLRNHGSAVHPRRTARKIFGDVRERLKYSKMTFSSRSAGKALPLHELFSFLSLHLGHFLLASERKIARSPFVWGLVFFRILFQSLVAWCTAVATTVV